MCARAGWWSFPATVGPTTRAENVEKLIMPWFWCPTAPPTSASSRANVGMLGRRRQVERRPPGPSPMTRPIDSTRPLQTPAAHLGGLVDAGFAGVDLVLHAILRRREVGHHDVGAAHQPQFAALDLVERRQRRGAGDGGDESRPPRPTGSQAGPGRPRGAIRGWRCGRGPATSECHSWRSS